ncbi:MAG TPA: POTRA domain-containing protein, partial [Chthoniobacteraceae bacterium]
MHAAPTLAFRRWFKTGFAIVVAMVALRAGAQDTLTPNQQPLPPILPLPPAAATPAPEPPAEAPPPAKETAKPARSNTDLPTNASPPDSDQPLLPNEMLLLPPAPRPPEAGPAQTEAPFQLHLAPPIEPMLPPLPSDLAGGRTLSSSLHVFVKGFRFKGNKVFSNRQLQKVVAKYAGRDLTGEELEEARQAVTLTYVQAGYINSGAILPDQDLEGGIVVFQIIEGRLTKINLSGNWWFRPWWLKHALYRAAGQPLNFNQLKIGLQLLRQDPNIRQINAELEPGGRPGESVLKAEVKENQPFLFGLDFSNRRPPSVGSEIVELHAADLNLTGHDDPLSITWGVAHTISDTPDHWEFSGTENIAGVYQFPITPWKTTLSLAADENDAAIVEAPFTLLNIKSRTEEYGATLRQPLYETLNNTLDFSIMGQERQSKTFLLDQPFDLSAGAINGETRLFVLRFILDYVNR